MSKQKLNRQDILALIGIVVTFLVSVILIITPELRETLGLEQMTIKQLSIFLIFITSCALIWQFGVWRVIRVEVPQFIIAEGGKDNELSFSNMQMVVEPDGKVILRTVISAFNNGIRRPIKELTPENFLVIETSEGVEKIATIMQAKPMTSPMRMIVLIDVSESMWGETTIIDNGTALKKIEVVKKAILEFSSKIITSKLSGIYSKPSYIAFLPFSSEGTFFLKREDESIWFPTIPGSVSEIEKSIDKLIPDGKTPMFDAVAHAITVIKNIKDERYKILFCLTDGVDNDSKITNEKLRNTLVSENIPVITAGYGDGEDIDEDILESMSTLSGAGGANIGSFSNVTPADLSALFGHVADDLNNTYEISWYSGFSKPGRNIMASIQATFLSASGKKISPVIKKGYILPVDGEHQI